MKKGKATSPATSKRRKERTKPSEVGQPTQPHPPAAVLTTKGKPPNLPQIKGIPSSASSGDITVPPRAAAYPTSAGAGGEGTPRSPFKTAQLEAWKRQQYNEEEMALLGHAQDERMLKHRTVSFGGSPLGAYGSMIVGPTDLKHRGPPPRPPPPPPLKRTTSTMAYSIGDYAINVSASQLPTRVCLSLSLFLH